VHLRHPELWCVVFCPLCEWYAARRCKGMRHEFTVNRWLQCDMCFLWWALLDKSPWATHVHLWPCMATHGCHGHAWRGWRIPGHGWKLHKSYLYVTTTVCRFSVNFRYPWRMHAVLSLNTVPFSNPVPFLQYLIYTTSLLSYRNIRRLCGNRCGL
jgi:hypothetical protein